MAENHTLELLRALRNDIQIVRTEFHAEFKDIKRRLTSLESSVIGSRAGHNTTDTPHV